VALVALTAVNGVNYADRYIGAAVLPLTLSGLSLSEAEGGVLQSAFILAYRRRLVVFVSGAYV